MLHETQARRVKAELLKQAEVLIDELLDWNEQTQAPDLTQIEDIVLKLRKQLGEQMALAVIDTQDSQASQPRAAVSDLPARDALQGCERQHGREPSRDAAAWNAVITIVRPVAQVFFPLDSQLRLWDTHWSEQVAKQAVWLSGLVTFEQAAEILQRVGQIAMVTSSVWQRSAKWGAQLQAVEAQQCAVASALPRAWQSGAG